MGNGEETQYNYSTMGAVFLMGWSEKASPRGVIFEQNSPWLKGRGVHANISGKNTLRRGDGKCKGPGLEELRVFCFRECIAEPGPACRVWLGRKEPRWKWRKWSVRGSPGPDHVEIWWPRSGTLNFILIWWKAMGKVWGEKVYYVHEGA